jgi:hypothetical protein
MFFLGLFFDLCVLSPMLFSLLLSQVTLVLVLVMTNVDVLLLASGTSVLLLKGPLRMSIWLTKLTRKFPKRQNKRRRPRRQLADKQGCLGLILRQWVLWSIVL